MRVAAGILGGFIPGFRIAYFPGQVLGIEVGLVEFFAGRVRQRFLITHNKSEPITAVRGDTGAIA